MADGRTAMGARTAALEKGRRKRAAFMLGYLEFCGSARCCGGPIGGAELAEGRIDALDVMLGARGDERRWCCGRGRFGGVAIVVRKSSHSCDPGICRVRAAGLALFLFIPPATPQLPHDVLLYALCFY